MKNFSMQFLRESILELGILDQVEVVMLLYLACTTRKMREKCSITVSGLSSLGKSTALKAATNLIPSRDKVEISIITRAALLSLDDLRGKFLVINETIPDRDLASPFRQLASEGEVHYWYKNKGKVEEKILLGPTPVLETTTTPERIDFQNRTRSLNIQLDPSMIDLDLRVERIKKRFAEPTPRNADFLSSLVNTHHRLQENLDKEIEVRIPFSKKIRFKPLEGKDQRLFENFLRLVSAVAFLHQHSRPIHTDEGGGKYIDATTSDYGEVFRLFRAVPIDTGTDILPEEAARFFAALKAHDDFSGPTPFTRLQISQTLKPWTQKRVRDNIDYLVDNDLLRCSTGRHGRYEYNITRIGKQLPADRIFLNCLNSLPSEKELLACLDCPSLPQQVDQQ